MATVKTPALNTKTTAGSGITAPSVQLVTSSTTQKPVFLEHVINQTVGEQPLYFCKMQDGTWAYVPENLLVNNGGKTIL